MFHLTRISSVLTMVLVAAGAAALHSDSAADLTRGPGVHVVAQGSVPDVLARIKKMVAANGMMVMGELHQGKVLSMTGLKTQSETLFVGNPTVGKKLFSAEPGAGLVVPVRINVYADARGRTIVRYIPPSKQLAAFGNGSVDKVASRLDGKLDKLVWMIGQ